METQQC